MWSGNAASIRPPVLVSPLCGVNHPFGEEAMLTYSLRLATNYNGMVMATFPDVPEAMALGRDHEEALDQAKAALEGALERYAVEGRDFPEPRTGGRLQVSTEKFGMLATA
jgi:predicted RNase H-like HicB family nuclease